MGYGPPIPLLMRSLGITSEKGRSAAEVSLNKFKKEHLDDVHGAAIQAIAEAAKNYPPEFHARLMAETIANLFMAVPCTVGLMVQVRMAGKDVEEINARRTSYFLDLIDHLEVEALRLRDVCIEREAQGFPEWDYEHPPVETPIDLGGLLEGVDLGWLSEDGI